MTMRAAKSIDELYEEVKEYDMVLCNDAPLATALNNRVSKPFIGEFAVTPRQIAADLGSEILKGPILDEIDLVRIVSEETGYSLKFVHGEIQNIERIRRHTKDVEKRLNRRSKKVYNSYIKLNTKDRAMERFDGEHNPIYAGKKVAVIGTDLFDELDKYVNPKFGTFEEISIFKRGKYEIPEIRELSNNREIAENVASLITPENCREVAIVLDVGGKMAATMKSALYRRKIPFINKLVVRDLNHIRDFLEFISLSLSFDLLRMGQIREIVGNYGGYINSKYDNYLAKGFDIDVKEKTKPILDLMDRIEEYTFEEVCDRIVGNSKKGQVKLMLDEIGILKEKVSERTADDLLYAVNNINDLKHNEQIPIEEKEGVLLVDCVNSVYIDRPIVFYLGLSNEWEKDVSFLNDIDYRLKDDEVDRNVDRFQVLLQQGKKRVYVVNSIKDGRASSPCSYFDHCGEDKVCERFSDVCENIVRGPWSEEMKNDIVIERGSEGSGDGESEVVFSNSSYNLFFSCPRAYMFSRLLGEPDNESTVTGTYIHSYAEFRFSYPEKAKEHDVEYYVEFIADRCLNLYAPDKRVIEKSIIRASITNINWLIDNIHIVPTFEQKRETKNCFIDESMKYSADQAEADMTVPEKGYGGRIDILGNDCIYDFKTGNCKGAKSIMEKMSLNEVTNYNHDFQPLFYFLLTELKGCGDIRDFKFFYTKANINGFTKGDDVEQYVEDNIIGVHIVDSMEQYFSDFYVDELFKNPKFSDYKSCKDKLVSIVIDYGLEHYASLKDNEEIAGRLGLDSKSNIKVINQVSKDFGKIYGSIEKCRCFADASDRNIFVLRESFADFTKDVELAKEKYKGYFETDFPALPKMECENCSFYDVCTATALKGGDENVGDE